MPGKIYIYIFQGTLNIEKRKKTKEIFIVLQYICLYPLFHSRSTHIHIQANNNSNKNQKFQQYRVDIDTNTEIDIDIQLLTHRYVDVNMVNHMLQMRKLSSNAQVTCIRIASFELKK